MLWQGGDKKQAIEYFSATVKPLIDEHLPYVAPLHIVVEPNSANAFCRRGGVNKNPQVHLNLKEKTLNLPWYELPEYYLHEQVHACQMNAADKGNSFWQTSENFGSHNREEKLANPMEYYARTIGKQASSSLIAYLNGQKTHV